MGVTPPRQRNAVSAGIALGLIMCGRREVPWGDMEVDFAVEEAWASWSYRDRFPEVTKALNRGEKAVGVMAHAERERRVPSLYWEMDIGKLVIRTRSGDPDIDHDKVASRIGGNVPADGWRDLAAGFLRRLEPEDGPSV